MSHARARRDPAIRIRFGDPSNRLVTNRQRLEIVTYTADGVTIQNATSGVAQNLTIGGGYVYCPDLAENAHQDGIQALGGTNITFQNLRIACGTSDANFGDGPNSQITIGKGGQGSGRPTDIVCDGCWLGPHASHTVLMGDSEDSGVSNSSYCTDRTPSGGWFDDTGATTPVNSSNTGFATAVCDAFSPYP